MRNRKFIFNNVIYIILYLTTLVIYNYYSMNNLLFQNVAKNSLISFYKNILSVDVFLFNDFTLKLIILSFNYVVFLIILLILLYKSLDICNKKIIKIIICIHFFVHIYFLIWFIR